MADRYRANESVLSDVDVNVILSPYMQNKKPIALSAPQWFRYLLKDVENKSEHVIFYYLKGRGLEVEYIDGCIVVKEKY